MHTLFFFPFSGSFAKGLGGLDTSPWGCLLGPEKPFYGESWVREWGPQGLLRHLLANPL